MKLHHIPELLLIPLSPVGLPIIGLVAFAVCFPKVALIAAVVGPLIKD